MNSADFPGQLHNDSIGRANDLRRLDAPDPGSPAFQADRSVTTDHAQLCSFALHGPITETLIRGYVSHGCARMRSADIIRLFWMVKQFASTPVTIQKEIERDAAGQKVDVGRAAALWPAFPTTKSL